MLQKLHTWLLGGERYAAAMTDPSPDPAAAPLTHFDEHGQARMVDVGEKAVTHRVAEAEAFIYANAETIARIESGDTKKGDVLAVARLAGIMGSKRTADLIPLCHPLPLDSVKITFAFPSATHLQIIATAKVSAKTGVEMEALTAASVAALTVYDMMKAVDRGMEIGPVRLVRKEGGKSGYWKRNEDGSLAE